MYNLSRHCFQGFRAEPGFNVFGKDFEPSLLLADTCVAVCPECAMKLSDSACDCDPGLFQVWYIRGLFMKQRGLIQSMEVTAYTSAGQPVEHVVWEWRSLHGLWNRNGNKCRPSERRWKRWIEHTDHDARCVSGGKATRCSRVPGSAHSRVDNIPVPQEGQPLFRSHSCLRLMCEFGGIVCPARGHLGLHV